MRIGLSRNLYTAAQVRGFDRTAIEQFGLPGLDLMRKAGRFCFARLRELWPDARSVVVLCGGGNNGGDGFVIAELAHRAGLNVTVLATADFVGLSADAGTALEDMRLSGIDAGVFNDLTCWVYSDGFCFGECGWFTCFNVLYRDVCADGSSSFWDDYCSKQKRI